MRLEEKLKGLVVTQMVLCLLIPGLGESNRSRWPQVASMKKTFTFPDARSASSEFTIVGIDGKPLYKVACHTAYYEGDRDFDYSGDFECRLKSLYSKDRYSTLFTDNPNQSRDWESRARIFAEELIGNCGDYPEYGRVRHFRLRGMNITFEFSELRFKESQGPGVKRGKEWELASFRFDFTAEPDPTAVSPIAEVAPLAEPPRANPKDPNDFSLKCDAVGERKK